MSNERVVQIGFMLVYNPNTSAITIAQQKAEIVDYHSKEEVDFILKPKLGKRFIDYHTRE